MSDIQLSDPLLAKLAGWQATKQARSLLAADRVLTSEWLPPTLRGTVQEGQATYRAGLLIRSETDADNLCTCRDSRQRGLICAHSIAVGLHVIYGPPRKATSTPEPVSSNAALVPGRTTEPEESATAKVSLHLSGGLAGLQAKLDGGLHTRSGQVAIARLAQSGFIGPNTAGFLYLRGQDAVLNFFARDYQRIENDWEVTLEERLEKSAESLERVRPQFQITPSGEQWFDLAVTYNTSSGEPLAASEVQRLLLTGQNHARLKNGKFALLDTGAVEELQEVLIDCAPKQHEGGYRVNNSQAGFLDATFRGRPDLSVQAPQAWLERAALQRGEVKPEIPPLRNLDSVLRPYQKEGVGWLNFLRLNRFGGILADEMGLGKTLQVLALLRALKGPQRGPALVVCPTSLVFNWEAEAKKFTPELRVLAVQGSDRMALFQQISSHDLVVTSYALLRRDAEHYRGVEFDTLVLDEAQHIKNRQTQNAQAVKTIRAAHKVVLTGTPMENSVLDLWSIFDFLMPGYLGEAQDFRERYEIPMTREKNSAAQTRLARRLRPFILRRAKKEVAADLPEKIEQVSYCELGEEQRAYYRQMLESGRREILNSVNKNGLAKSRMLVLTTLLRLRQICCDIRLLKTGSADQTPPPSGKVELFHELIEETLDGGHRALVFSQFTTMLGLLREELTSQNIQSCYLDGSTKDRAGVVEKFQNDPTIPIFLISLKAGGTGLNLTGADTVIHFDPWWNPAVEAQATDRAHRIGQRNIVTSYKLITRGTVEEKILNLQARKRELTQAVLAGDEEFAGTLTWEEIRDLIA
ncbi:MAG TPA: SNF2-related protein [Verrucomicrobiae bacterium]